MIRELSRKLLCGIYGLYIIYCYISARQIYIFVSGDLLPSMWYSLLRKSVSLDACTADQFYITTVVLTIFPVKQITHVAIAKTYTSMKARDVKNENQMKSSFFRSSLSQRKGKVSYFIPLYDKHKYKLFICCVKVAKFVCK